jgi:cysteine desulfurase
MPDERNGAREIYLDNAATTPLDPRVAERMEPFLSSVFGNPSSLHAAGQRARRAVEEARGQVAALLGAAPGEIVFTASGTESDNLALVGAYEAQTERRHIVASAIEHPAVLETLRHLERRGARVTLVAPRPDGIVSPDDVAASLRPDTLLVSVMAANNVVGTLQPVAEIGRLCRERGVLFHCDAVQAAATISFDAARLAVDLLSLSAHKLYGPKGVGALFVASGVRLAPIVHGGGQERGLRSATENVAGIAGLGAAAAILRAEGAADAARLVRLRERLLEGLALSVPNARLLGHRLRRLPGHLCLGLEGQEGETIKLLLALDEAGIAVSAGSACSARHASEPSHVLVAMGLDPIRARGSVRVSLGRFNTEDDVDRFLSVFPAVVGRMRPVMSRNIARA